MAHRDQNDRPRYPYEGETESREQALRRRLRQPVESYDDEEDDEEDYAPRYGYRRSAPYPPQRSGSSLGALYAVLGILAIVLLGIVMAPRLLNNAAAALPESVAQIVASPTPTIRDRGGTITQIKALNRLETQQISVERVIDAGVQGNALQNLLFGDRILLIAGGDVVAGVDLSKLKTSDVSVSSDGKRITLSLPPSELFNVTLDAERTRVYDRQRGLLAAQNKDLESEARQAAEAEILKAACEKDVMQKAATEAQRNMEQFLSLLEFDSVTVNAPIGKCQMP